MMGVPLSARITEVDYRGLRRRQPARIASRHLG